MENDRLVALYVRVSTKDKGQDYLNQLRQLREFCSKMGWNIAGEYCDRKSAKNSDRTEFQRLFADASRRKFDLVLFWSLDRFSREGVLGTLQMLQTLTSYGVGYRSFTEQYLDSCGLFKDAVLAILATIARQERVRLSERVLAGMARARAKGSAIGRPRVNASIEKAQQLQRDGASLATIAAQLNVSKSSAARLVRTQVTA